MADILKALITSFIGSFGFCILLHAPKKALLPAAAMGAITYLVYFLGVTFGIGTIMASLIAAAVGSLLTQLAARKTKTIASVFLTAALIPLVPGLALYECMTQLARGDEALGLKTGIEAMKIILMLTVGMGFGSFIFALGPKRKKRA